MNNKYSIRLSDEERELLEAKAMKLGYSSTASFARKLISNGLQDYSIKITEEHVLYNSAQAVLLLRELINLFACDEERSAQIIEGAKHTSENWISKLKESVGE